jgi:hypothetical protein
MSQTKQSANTTHRKRLARLYAEATGLTYQQALTRVVAAADAGLLPSPLNPVGMYTALAVLADMDATPTPPTPAPPSTVPSTGESSDTTLLNGPDATDTPDFDTAPSAAAWSPSKRAREEGRLLDLLDQHNGRAHIAGIVECLAALSLSEQSKIVIEDSTSLTPDGGSGWIRKPDHRLQTWFVAHEGNPVPRCTGTSWRGGSGARAGHGYGYGPGGFNRCVKAEGHTPEAGGNDPMHVDEWGNVFRMTPKFKVVRNISNAEMAEVAREAGMAVGTNGQFQSKAEALQPNTLWMTADNEMVKLSTVYADEGRVTAQVVLPVPPRTTVRSYTLAAAAAWKSPSTAQIRKYNRAWGFDD